jgi:NAD(P)-dependent dehydrogenase (short-subunit alcohol dehydrogenase family)
MDDGKKVALLTGAAGGLGRAVALRLVERGYSVALCDYGEAVHELAAALSEDGHPVLGISYDVADADAAWAAHEQTAEVFGAPPTAIVTAAAIVDQVKYSWRLTPQMWQREVDVNLTGAFYAIAPALPRLRETPGRIVVVSSVAAHNGLVGQVAYSATKAGLEGMVRSLAKELGRSGTTVNTVLPGAIATPKFVTMPDAIQDRARAAIPLGRFADTTEVADLIEFLLSDRAAYITGASLVVDGGLSLADYTFGATKPAQTRIE